MSYDPFARGPHPVGVETRVLADGDRRITTELYYPADDAHAGEDLDRKRCDRFEVLPGFGGSWQSAVRDARPRPGRFPLALFSHGFGSDRRQSSFLCTHLASHGFAVAAPDHAGNTIFDMMQMVMSKGALGSGLGPGFFERMAEVARQRPGDLLFVAEALGGALPQRIDAARVAALGHSFGGWTALMAAAQGASVAATVTLAPAGGAASPIAEPLREHLDLAWGRPVPSLVVAAERDSLLPLAGMRELFGRMPRPKRMMVLTDTDHMHFCDRPEAVHQLFRATPQLAPLVAVAEVPPFSALCPAEHAHLAVRGLALAHLDATLRDDAAAASFLEREAMSALSRRGIDVERVD